MASGVMTVTIMAATIIGTAMVEAMTTDSGEDRLAIGLAGQCFGFGL